MNRFGRVLNNTWKSLVLPVGMYVLLLVLSQFLGTGKLSSWASIQTILRNSMYATCIALAMTCNMLNNRWDFSIGLMTVLIPVLVLPFLTKWGAGPVGLLIGCIVAGLILSMVNAVCYLLIKVPTLVVSIGLMLFYESVIFVYNGGHGARITQLSMLKLGQVPLVFIVGIVAVAIFFILYTFTRFGYNVRSLASFQSLAASTGINEKRNLIGCYLLCGLMAGFAGALYVCSTGTLVAATQYNGSMTILFEAFPPVFIGLYLMRYCNLAIGVLIGTITMKTLNAGMLALGINAAIQSVGIGIFLMLFIAFTTNQHRFQEFRDAKKRINRINIISSTKL